MSEEVIDVQPWKGKDEIVISEEKDTYIVVEHRKNKENLEVKPIQHIIPKQNVINLWNIIRENCELREQYGYRYLVRKLIEQGKMDIGKIIPEYKILDMYFKDELLGSKKFQNTWYEFVSKISMEAFGGGKFRKAVYFIHLYYPLKCLEHKGYVVFFGRGGCMRISDEVNVR